MNLTELKASAELAKASRMELDLWQESLQPDDLLRLVEVARLAKELRQIDLGRTNASEAFYWASARLYKALEGIEP